MNDEGIQEALYRLNDYRTDRNQQNFAHAIRQLKNAIRTVIEHLQTIVKDLLIRTELTELAVLYRPSAHTDEEVKLFREIRLLNYSAKPEDHFSYVRKLTDFLEIKIRRFLYFTSSLLFGKDYFEHCPQSLRAYAFKNLESRSSYAAEENKFDGLTRPQFKQIFLQGNDLREQITKHLDLAWKEADMEMFFNIFATENIKTAHQQVSAYSPSERQRYLRYAVMAEELFAAMNHMVSEYIVKSVYLSCGIQSPRPMDVVFRHFIARPAIKPEEGQDKRVFSKWPASFLNKTANVEQKISDDSFARISQIITGKIAVAPEGVLVVDLLEIGYIVSHYRVSLAEFVNCIAYGKLFTKSLIVEPFLGSSVGIRALSN